VDRAGFHEFEQRGWEQVADRYDGSWASVTRQAIPALLDAANVHPGSRLLDVACGPGYVAEAARKLGANATGIDFSEAMIAEARRRYPAVEFREGDAECLDFPDSVFDAVVSNFGMLHLAQPERALFEAHRVLRTGGRVAFTVWDAPERAVAHGIVLGAIRSHGDVNAPIPSGPPFFRFSDPEESARTLTACGFRNPSVAKVEQIWRLASPGDLFEIMYNGSVRNAALLRAQTPEALESIRGALRKEVEVRCGVLPMPAVLASADRP